MEINVYEKYSVKYRSYCSYLSDNGSFYNQEYKEKFVIDGLKFLKILLKLIKYCNTIQVSFENNYICIIQLDTKTMESVNHCYEYSVIKR